MMNLNKVIPSLNVLRTQNILYNLELNFLNSLEQEEIEEEEDVYLIIILVVNPSEFDMKSYFK
jgi:hypothetical protein